MADVAVKYKHAIISLMIIITTLLVLRFIYKFQYIRDYHEIKLSKAIQISDSLLNINEPYWVIVTNSETKKNIEMKHDVLINDVDFKTQMIIISYGAELKSIDYNVQESTFKTRGYYVGFPAFGEIESNNIYIYITEFIPILDAEVAGFSPEYKGKYR